MTDELKRKIIAIVEQTLNSEGDGSDIKIVIDENDSMETIGRWDSVTFMKVFLAINQSFALDPDFDDAINYISISALYDYLKPKVRE